MSNNRDRTPLVGLVLFGTVVDSEVNSGVSQRTGRPYRMVTVWVQAGRQTFQCMLSRRFGPVGSPAEFMEPGVGEVAAWNVEPTIETYNQVSSVRLVIQSPVLNVAPVAETAGV